MSTEEAELQLAVYQLRKELHEKNSELHQKENKIKQHEALIRDIAKSQSVKKVKTNNELTDFEKSLQQTITKKTFRNYKFVTNLSQEMQYLCAVILDHNYEVAIGNTPEAEAQTSVFCHRYGSLCIKTLNDQRNYVQSEMRKKCIEYLAKNNYFLILNIHDH